MKKQLSTVDKEAAKWVADSTPANLKNSTVDKEAAKMIADSTPGKQRNLSSIDIEARELFNLPSIASEDKADLASQTASLKAKLSGNKIGTLESAISNLKTKIQSN